MGLATAFFAITALVAVVNGNDCDPSYPYRSIDGTCNNLANPSWGSANTLMPRTIPAKDRETGNEPNERTVTLSLLSAPDRGIDDAELDTAERAMGTEPEGRGLNSLTVFVMQFLSHDISLIPLTSFFDQGAAFGIPIPNCETFEDVGVNDALCGLTTDRRTGTDVLQNQLVTRNSVGDIGPDGVMAPFNKVTSYIDLSPVYGSDDKTANTLRSGSGGGKLIIGPNNELPRNSPETGIFTASECDLFGPSDTTHMVGDVRGDENFIITVIHLMFLRQHNRIADDLASANPDWDDEKLYQEARKRNVAIFQHIIYDEVFPRVYGVPATQRWLGNYKGYNDAIDASTNIEFSTAAFRLHSMVNLPSLFLSDSCGMNKGVVAPVSNPDVVQERTNCDPVDFRRVGHVDILRGALIQTAQEYDNRVTRTLMNIRIGAPGNVDVQAANIFRGRQHSLGSIDDLRMSVGLPSVFDNRGGGNEECIADATTDSIECFRKLVTNITLAEQMQSLYGRVVNVDPYVALLGDVHATQSSIGEAATLFSLQQFKMLRDGDRFWYEGTLTQDELKEVKKLTLSDLLKTNFPELASEIPDDALEAMDSDCV